MKRLDSDIRETVAAASEDAPEGYFDELEARIAARLEGDEMRGVGMSKGGGSGRGTEAPPAAVATGTGSQTTAKDEDSGLIDIKDMARSTKRRVTSRQSTESDVEESLLASSRPSALRDVVLPDPDKAQPVRLATEADEHEAAAATAGEEPESRKGGAPWLAIAAAVVLIGGGAAAWFATRGSGDTEETGAAAGEQTVAQAQAPAGAGGETPSLTESEEPEPGALAADDDEAEADPADESGTADETAEAPVEPAAEPEPKAKPDKQDRGKKVARAERRRGKADRKRDEKPERKADEPAETPPKDQPTGDLDSLLDRAAGETDKKAEKKEETESKAPKGKTKLTRSEVQNGMRSVKARVAACYERYKQPGTVKVKVVISNTGVVTKSVATGKFKDTDTGACVGRAVSNATFPEFNGPSMSLTYPFLLQ